MNEVSAILLFLLALSIGAGSILLAGAARRQLARRRRERRRARALSALGMSLEQALAEAPYEYAHWQGEDGYRIIDVRAPKGFVGFAGSKSEAELWIVERYLAEKTQESNPPDAPA